jgi:SAM-dependent methyltransferase
MVSIGFGAGPGPPFNPEVGPVGNAVHSLLTLGDDLDALLAEQITYYRARAPEYDEVYTGRDWWDAFVDELPITGAVLELACGTGRWTPLLARRAQWLTAVDAAPEMLALARRRVEGLPVELVEANVFTWQPPRRYDTVFFAFWLSHVPPRGSPHSGRRSARRWRQAAGSASSTAVTVSEAASRCCPASQAPPSGAASATAASTERSRCSTRLRSSPPGSRSWGGRHASVR